MVIYNQIQQAKPLEGKAGSSVALGCFDGLHLGHAAVIHKAVQLAGQTLAPAVFTFTMNHDHPQGKHAASRLITQEDKEKLLAAWGVQLELNPDFSQFREMSPHEFFREILLERLEAKSICCGMDFRFGKNAGGDVYQLARFCHDCGIHLELVPEVDLFGSRVSSTRIRRLLEEGRVEAANQLLGRAFGYRLLVIQGKRLGRTLDSPTINQPFPKDFVAIKHGVYASVTLVENRWRPSVTNIGLRPTVENTDQVNSETYICDYAGDLYGQKVAVRLIQFLRPEQKFPDVETLRAGIQGDVREARPIAEKYLKAHGLN